MKILHVFILSINIYLTLQISADFYARIFKNLKENLDRDLSDTLFYEDPEFSLWPNGIVKVYFNKSMSDEIVQYVQLIMKYIEENSCIKFVKATNLEFLTEKVLRIMNTYGNTLCDADIEKQIIGVSPETCKHGVIIQNFMTILGFEKEELREDRDDYINVIWDNILEDDKKYFRIPSFPNIPHLNLPYDLSSIMHDNINYKSWNNKSDTFQIKTPPINTRPEDVRNYMGQQRKLSMVDIAKLNKAYNCSIDRIPMIVRVHMKQFQVMYEKKIPYLDKDLRANDRRTRSFRRFDSDYTQRLLDYRKNSPKYDEEFRKGSHPSNIEKYLEPSFVSKFYKEYQVDIREVYKNLLRDVLDKHLPPMSSSDFDMKPKGLKDVGRYKEIIDKGKYMLHFPSGENWPRKTK